MKKLLAAVLSLCMVLALGNAWAENPPENDIPQTPPVGEVNNEAGNGTGNTPGCPDGGSGTGGTSGAGGGNGAGGGSSSGTDGNTGGAWDGSVDDGAGGNGGDSQQHPAQQTPQTNNTDETAGQQVTYTYVAEIPATCDKSGTKAHYNGSDGKFYWDEGGKNEVTAAAELVIPALGHDYEDPKWTWNSEYTKAAAIFKCKRSGCEHVEEIVDEDIECCSYWCCNECGNYLVTNCFAEVEFNGKIYQDTKKIISSGCGTCCDDFGWGGKYCFSCGCCNGEQVVCATDRCTGRTVCWDVPSGRLVAPKTGGPSSMGAVLMCLAGAAIFLKKRR